MVQFRIERKILFLGFNKGVDIEIKRYIIRYKEGFREEVGGSSFFLLVCFQGDEGRVVQVIEDFFLERLGFWSCFLRVDLVGEFIVEIGYKVRKLSYWV